MSKITFNDLYLQYQKSFGISHNIVFFEIIFFISRNIKNKNLFVKHRNNKIDFNIKKYQKLLNDYFVSNKPLAHITKRAKFMNIDFIINKGVLAPRDITENMVNQFILKHDMKKKYNVIDLCCGSGCIGLSIKKYLPYSNVICVDKYQNPINNTIINAKHNKLKISILKADAIDYLNNQGKIDILISNPPYINENNFNLEKMYKWENKYSLIASDNGLFFIKNFIIWLSNHSFNEAWIEFGYDQYTKIKKFIKKFKNLHFKISKCQFIVIYKKNI